MGWPEKNSSTWSGMWRGNSGSLMHKNKMAAIHHHTCRLHQEGEKWNQSSLCTLYTRDHFSLSILLCCSWLYTQGCVCVGVRGRESEREKRRERDCGQGCFTPIISLSFLHYHWCSHQTSQLNTALVTLYISHPFCKNTILEKKKICWTLKIQASSH